MTTTLSLEDLPLGDNLPSLPAVALQVVQIAQDPLAGIDDLTTALARDPALSAKVLQMANSPMFARGGGEITSLSRAASLLGFRTIKVIALGFSLAKELVTTGETGGFSLDGYWHRSLMNAVIARTLAQVIDSRFAEEAFLAGLLADVGKLVLAQSSTELYAPIVEASDGWPSTDQEHAELGFDSVDVSCALLDRWGVPALFADALRSGSRGVDAPLSSSNEARELSRLVRLALCANRVFFDVDRGAALAEFQREAEDLLGFDDDDVDAVIAKVEAGVAETASIFEVALPAGVSLQQILDAARMSMMMVSLDATADLAHERERSKEFESRSLTDALTGLSNRASLDQFLEMQIQARLRGEMGKWLGVVMIDIDKFKSFNDTYGHQAGDEVLRTVGRVLREQTRGNEFVARYGGEEFSLVAPTATPDELRVAAERLRSAIEVAQVDIGGGTVVQVTASFGVACIETVSSPDAGQDLVERADRQLYLAKENGRNRVEVE